MISLRHLLEAHRAFKKQILSGLKEYDLMPGHPKILYYIRLNEGCQQKEIARNCCIESATLSTVLSNMERRGLIERKPLETDRRAYRVFLTEKARPICDAVVRQFDDTESLALSGFSEEEKDALEKYLIRIENNLYSSTKGE